MCNLKHNTIFKMASNVIMERNLSHMEFLTVDFRFDTNEDLKVQFRPTFSVICLNFIRASPSDADVNGVLSFSSLVHN